MNPNHRIVICGKSVFLTAIESALAGLPELEVIRLNPHLPAIEEQVVTMNPDLVIVEQDGGHGDLALALLNGGLPLVELNTQTSQATLLTGRKVSVVDSTDLTGLIERLVGVDRPDQKSFPN